MVEEELCLLFHLGERTIVFTVPSTELHLCNLQFYLTKPQRQFQTCRNLQAVLFDLATNHLTLIYGTIQDSVQFNYGIKLQKPT
jgi:hypothetical protein